MPPSPNEGPTSKLLSNHKPTIQPIEFIKTGDIPPGKIIEDPVIREKLHTLMMQVGFTSWNVKFSWTDGVIYISFSHTKESIILRGPKSIGIVKDYTGSGANIVFNEDAQFRIRKYLASQSIKSALADMHPQETTTA